MAKTSSRATKPSHPGRWHRWGQRHLFGLSVALFCLSVVVLLVALTIERQTTSGPPPFRGYQPGITVTMGEVSMRLDSVTVARGSGIFTAPAGMHYVIPTLTVKNLVDKPINVLPSSDIYMKDTSGHVTLLTPYQLTDPFRAGELLPGDSITGQLSYLVPDHTTEQLYIDAIWSGGVVPFTVQ